MTWQTLLKNQKKLKLPELYLHLGIKLNYFCYILLIGFISASITADKSTG